MSFKQDRISLFLVFCPIVASTVETVSASGKCFHRSFSIGEFFWLVCFIESLRLSSSWVSLVQFTILCASGNQAAMLARILSERSIVTSSTTDLDASGICMMLFTVSSIRVPFTYATMEPFLQCASLLDRNVYSSPLDRDVSSMERFGPMFPGETFHSSAWSASSHSRKPER